MAAAPTASGSFPASRRIKAGRDFLRAKTEGRRVVHGCLILNWLPTPGAACSRLGVITSRKVGPAVVRSRSRRLLREAFRLHQQELTQPVDVVLVARPSIAGKDRAGVERDYLTALQRCGLRPASPPSPPSSPGATPGPTA